MAKEPELLLAAIFVAPTGNENPDTTLEIGGMGMENDIELTSAERRIIEQIRDIQDGSVEIVIESDAPSFMNVTIRYDLRGAHE